METYYIYINGNQTGPHTLQDIASMIARQEITLNNLCWTEGMSEWMPICETIDTNRIEIDTSLTNQELISKKPFVGLSRSDFRWWFLVLIIAGIFISAATDSEAGLLLAFFIAIPLSAFRYYNMGSSPLWCIFALIPLVALIVFLKCLTAPTSEKFIDNDQ